VDVNPTARRTEESLSTVTIHDHAPSAPGSLVAPPWHTAVLVAFFIVLAIGGARFQSARAHSQVPQQHADATMLYVSLIAGQWGLLYYVWKGGLRRTNTKLSDLIGGRWQSWRDVVTDLAVAILQWVVFWAASAAFVRAWTRFIGADHASSVRSLLPVRGHEVVLWILLSVSAGICEEVVFRGYFQRQFAAFAKSNWLGVLLQATLFGVAHGYQGVASCILIVMFGLIYGATAMWRKSLRSGMIAHAATDILGGLFRV
jgi:membrane protease YdiL (CAAX protease family)